ncbi:hypothetical protein E4U53_007505 [Claviceps sorghi]|nr:hypothetical protein E4U53_007505 [Claviceps sorghi]
MCMWGGATELRSYGATSTGDAWVSLCGAVIGASSRRGGDGWGRVGTGVDTPRLELRNRNLSCRDLGPCIASWWSASCGATPLDISCEALAGEAAKVDCHARVAGPSMTFRSGMLPFGLAGYKASLPEALPEAARG